MIFSEEIVRVRQNATGHKFLFERVRTNVKCISLFRKNPKYLVVTQKNKYYTTEQERLAKIAKALSHPARVFILDFLAARLDQCCYSGDMIEDLPIARSTLSEHLKELKKAGLIQGEINPPYIRYCINRENWEEARLILDRFLRR